MAKARVAPSPADQRNNEALELLSMSAAGLPPRRRTFTWLRRQREGLDGGRA
jgi:hypothetical protein